jgi:spermidine synthase
MYSLRFVTLDGSSMTGLHRYDGDLSRFAYLRHAVIAAPYQLLDRAPRVLSVGVGGGLDILLARLYEADEVTAIDVNADVVDLLSRRFADYSGQLADQPKTRLLVAEGRSFLLRDRQQYDLIQGIGLDNLAALTSGAYVLAESYLYTVEAAEAALARLTPHGVYAWTRNTGQPPSETLRLAGQAAEALRRRGAADPPAHLAVVGNEQDSVATLLASPSPLRVDGVERLRRWARENRFQMLHDPLDRQATPYADYLYATDRRSFEATYPFQISPATDDRPFFFSYFKWSNLRVLASGIDPQLRLPIGNLILLSMSLAAIGSIVLFIGLPLVRRRAQQPAPGRAAPLVAYFGALGCGYVVVQVVLIQRLTLFVGYPALAASLAIFSMLWASGLGSMVARHACRSVARLRAVLLAVAALLIAYLGLPHLLAPLLALPDLARATLAVALMVPPALLMGMPFPTGLARLAATTASALPWAWGLNGAFSVLGSVLAVLVGMQLGFSAALVLAAGLYALAALVAPKVWGVDVNAAGPG